MTLNSHHTTNLSAALMLSVPTFQSAPEAASVQAPTDLIRHGRVDAFMRSPLNPRKSFVTDSIKQLAVSVYKNTVFNEDGSVAQTGILTPLIVRQVGDVLEIGAGERRHRAVALLVEGFDYELSPADGETPAHIVHLKVGADYPIPYQIRALSDNDLVDLGWTENSNRESLSVLEKVDVVLFWDAQGCYSEEEMALKAGVTLPTLRQYKALGYGLGRDARRMLEKGQISMSQARVLASISGPLKPALIKAAKEGMSAEELRSAVKANAMTPDVALFDVARSGLKVEERLLDTALPARFEDQKAAMAAQLEEVNRRADAIRAQGEGAWADVVMVEGDEKVLPTAYTHKGQTQGGTVYTVNTVTGAVGHFEGVYKVSAERTVKTKGKGKTSSVNAAEVPAVKPKLSRQERDDKRADDEAKQEAIVEGLYNSPRVTLAHTALTLLELGRVDRSNRANQNYVKDIAAAWPQILRELSPGVLGVKDRAEALRVMVKWSESALIEMLSYLTSVKERDEAYTAALEEVTQ